VGVTGRLLADGIWATHAHWRRVASGSARGRVVDALGLADCLLAGLANGGVIERLAGFQGDAVAVGDEAARNGQDLGAWYYNSN